MLVVKTLGSNLYRHRIQRLRLGESKKLMNTQAPAPRAAAERG